MAPHVWLFLGSLNGFFGVLAGAYGRHGALDAGGREYFAIASGYQIAHAVVLLIIAWLAGREEGRLWLSPVHFAGAAFTLGTWMFAGALYWLAFSGLVPFEGMAPAGGMLLVLGWFSLMMTGARNIMRTFRRWL